MKALALFGSIRKSKDSQKLNIKGQTYYVRPVIIARPGRASKDYLANALDIAHTQARKSETVLNAIPLPG